MTDLFLAKEKVTKGLGNFWHAVLKSCWRSGLEVNGTNCICQMPQESRVVLRVSYCHVRRQVGTWWSNMLSFLWNTFLLILCPLESSRQCSGGTQVQPVLKATADTWGTEEKPYSEPSDPWACRKWTENSTGVIRAPRQAALAATCILTLTGSENWPVFPCKIITE